MTLINEKGEQFSAPSWMIPGNDIRGLNGQNTNRQEVRQTEECGKGSNSSLHKLLKSNNTTNEGNL